MAKPMTYDENSVVAQAQAAMQRVLREGIRDDARRNELMKVAATSILLCYLDLDDHFSLELNRGEQL